MMILLQMTGIAETAVPDVTPAPGVQAVQAVVSTPSGPLKMRSEAGDSGRIVTKIPNKKTVTVLSHEGEWTQVSYGKYTGFVKSVYLVENSKSAVQEYESLLYPGLPITYVHKEAKESSQIISPLWRSDYFVVLERGNEWSKVKYGNNNDGYETGYVLTSTLKPETQEEEDASPSKHQFMYAELASSQSVYKEADASSAITGTMEKNFIVEVYYVIGSWANVSDGTMQGWVKTSAVDFKEEEVPASNGGLVDFVANYYTATTSDTIVQLYFNPTSATADNHYITLKLGAKDKLMVLVRDYKAGDTAWSKVSDGEYVGWMPTGSLLISDTMETYTYKQNIVSGTTGVAYAKEDGVKVYDGYPADGQVLLTLNKGEEITIQLTVSQDFVAVLRGGAYFGNVKKSDITMGLMDVKGKGTGNGGPFPAKTPPRGTPAPQKNYDGMEKLSKDAARAIGESALSGKYEGFAGPSNYTLDITWHENEPTQFEQPYWQFDYLAPRADHPDLTIVKFTVMVHAYTKEIVYTTQGWEPDLTEITYNTPVPTAEPVYSEEELANALSKSDALSIGQSTLSGKYPDFNADRYQVSIQYRETNGSFQTPYWQIDYLDERGSAEYSVCVHAYTRKILYTNGPGGGNG